MKECAWYQEHIFLKNEFIKGNLFNGPRLIEKAIIISKREKFYVYRPSKQEIKILVISISLLKKREIEKRGLTLDLWNTFLNFQFFKECLYINKVKQLRETLFSLARN